MDPKIDFAIFKTAYTEEDHTDPYIGAGFITEAIGYEGSFKHTRNILDGSVSGTLVTGFVLHRIEDSTQILKCKDLHVVVLLPKTVIGDGEYNRLTIAFEILYPALDLLKGTMVECYQADVGVAFRIRDYDESLFNVMVEQTRYIQ